MAGTRTWVDRHSVIQPDEAFTSPSISVTNNATDTVVTSLQIRWGKRCYLVGLASVVDAGGTAYTTFSLRKDGVPLYPFAYATSQWGSITNPMRMINAYELSQGQLLTITANIAAAAPTAFFCAGRIMVEYEDF